VLFSLSCLLLFQAGLTHFPSGPGYNTGLLLVLAYADLFILGLSMAFPRPELIGF
jgi:hypothetical protein